MVGSSPLGLSPCLVYTREAGLLGIMDPGRLEGVAAYCGKLFLLAVTKSVY